MSRSYNFSSPKRLHVCSGTALALAYWPANLHLAPNLAKLLFFINVLFIVILYMYMLLYRSQGSSVSIVSGYGLDNQVIEVRSLAEA
jgi:hypothetical protein